MELSQKQLELMTHLVTANIAGEDLDLDQLIEAASYKPTKQSIQFSIRNLMEKGFITREGPVKRRGRQRVLIVPTPAGKEYVRPTHPVVHFIESASDTSFKDEPEEELFNPDDF